MLVILIHLIDARKFKTWYHLYRDTSANVMVTLCMVISIFAQLVYLANNCHVWIVRVTEVFALFTYLTNTANIKHRALVGYSTYMKRVSNRQISNQTVHIKSHLFFQTAQAAKLFVCWLFCVLIWLHFSYLYVANMQIDSRIFHQV